MRTATPDRSHETLVRARRIARTSTLVLVTFLAGCIGCHPDPSAFDRWAEGGPCPYGVVGVGRAAKFSEKASLWGPDRPLRRPWDLLMDLFAARDIKYSEQEDQA